MMEKVYVVAYQSPDISHRFVEIKGIFRSLEQARKFREEVFDAEGKETHTLTYVLLDENHKGKV